MLFEPNFKAIQEAFETMDTPGQCQRADCRVVIITNNDIHIYGYNEHYGNACVIEHNHCVRAIHAEASAIAKAARNGISLKGACAVLNQRPCQRCLMLMASSGVTKVYYFEDYHSKAHHDEFIDQDLMNALCVQHIQP